MTPTADHYARALVEAAKLTGELAQLQAISKLKVIGPRGLRTTPLKSRALAYKALTRRFPDVDARGVARAIGLSTIPKRVVSYDQADVAAIVRAL